MNNPSVVESVFLAALEQGTPEARAALLDQACAGDAELRRHVEQLLAASERMGDFLDRPAAAAQGTGAYEPAGERPSATVGPYKLLHQIGEGGMGVVWMAEQQEPIRRKVALKVIKPGMDSRQVIARFEAERQALAMMDHLNIARVLDAGTTEGGRPYFVMELVHGVPITKYCDDNRLTPRQRLELFVPVCQAIQHAHQKGVIHRDIKPSNVLVTMHDDRAVPKVIDFGIAKAVAQPLTEKTLFTQYGTMIGTFEYMSPEQAEMNAFGVDTRSDVYSLGVLLYELLTGTTPLERERLREAAYGEIVRLIREEEPARPSQRLSGSGEVLASISRQRNMEPGKLTGLVRGELDWLVMKCLEKDRTRRYETASGLARDVERYLKDEPVEACPPTLTYRLRKAYRKHRAAVLIAAAFAAVLVAAAAVSVAFGLLARQAAMLAEGRRIIAEESDQETQEANEKLKIAHGDLRVAHADLRSNSYLWDMQMMPSAWAAGNVGQMREGLARHVPTAESPEDRRAFEWHYWDRKCHPERASRKLEHYTVPDGRIYSHWEFSGNGTRVANLRAPYPMAGSPNPKGPQYSEVSVWDVASGKKRCEHRMTLKQGPPAEAVESGLQAELQQSDNGHRIAVARVFTHPKRLSTPSWVSGRAKGIAQWKQIQVVEVATGETVFAAEDWTVAIGKWHLSPDGNRLAAVVIGPEFPEDKKALKVWDLNSGKELFTIAGASGRFSADGKSIVGYALEYQPPLHALAAQVVTSRTTPSLAGAVAQLHFLNRFNMGWRGERLAKVWDAGTGEELTSWKVERGHTHVYRMSPRGRGGMESTADGTWHDPSPDGRWLASWVEDLHSDPKPPVKVWDTATGEKRYSFTVPFPLPVQTHTLSFFSPDGTRLAFWKCTPGDTNRVAIWDLVTGKETCTIALGRTAPLLEFSRDGRRLVEVSGTLITGWDTDTGKVAFTLHGLDRVAALVFSRDGRRLFSVDGRGTLKEWEIQPKEPVLVPFGPSEMRVERLELSPDATRIARVVTGDRGWKVEGVEVWDAVTAQRQTRLTPRPREGRGLSKLAFSGDGKKIILARGLNNQRSGWSVSLEGALAKLPPIDLTVWDVATGAEVTHLELLGRRGIAQEMAFAPGLSHVALSDRWSTEKVRPDTPPKFSGCDLKMVNLATGREIWKIELPGRVVAGLSFSPDGERLAGLVGSAALGPTDEEAKLTVWEFATGKELAPAASVTWRWIDRTAITWAPDGKRLAIWSTMRYSSGRPLLKAHDAATCKELFQVVEPTGGARGYHLGAVTFSPDSRRIAALMFGEETDWEGKLKVWDAATGKELLTLGLDTTTAKYWVTSPTGKREAPTLNPHSMGSVGLSFTRDGHRLVFFSTRVLRTPIGSVAVETWDATPRAKPAGP